jgi:hypothetical protein
MTSWGLWDTTRRRREKAGEKASRMEPNISEGLVIAEGGLLLLRQALFWTIVYYSTGGKRGVYYDMGVVGDEAFGIGNRHC